MAGVDLQAKFAAMLAQQEALKTTTEEIKLLLGKSLAVKREPVAVVDLTDDLDEPEDRRNGDVEDAVGLTRAVVEDKYFVDLILAGKKTKELRTTKPPPEVLRCRVAIAHKGEAVIRGSVRVADYQRLTKEQLKTEDERRARHATDECIDHYGKSKGALYAWILAEPFRYTNGFEHKKISGPTIRDLSADEIWKESLRKAKGNKKEAAGHAPTKFEQLRVGLKPKAEVQDVNFEARAMESEVRTEVKAESGGGHHSPPRGGATPDGSRSESPKKKVKAGPRLIPAPFAADGKEQPIYRKASGRFGDEGGLISTPKGDLIPYFNVGDCGDWTVGRALRLISESKSTGEVLGRGGCPVAFFYYVCGGMNPRPLNCKSEVLVLVAMKFANAWLSFQEVHSEAIDRELEEHPKSRWSRVSAVICLQVVQRHILRARPQARCWRRHCCNLHLVLQCTAQERLPW